MLLKKSAGRNLVWPSMCALMTAAAISPALAANTTFTYQGRVTANGTDYSGQGLFKFALVTSSNVSSQATAIANLTGGFVTSCTVIYGGSGYTTPPAVSFSGGGGSGATATAVVSGGQVTALIMGNAGSGYTNAPTVTIESPPTSITFTTYWSNDGTSVDGSEPAAAVSTAVTGGLFTIVLGDTTLANMDPIDASLFAEPDLQLRIWFDDGVHGSAALSPVQTLTPAPYAISLSGTLSAASLTSIGNTTGDGNFFVGPSGNPTTTGLANTGMGELALQSNTSGGYNTGMGYATLFSNTNGTANTAVGVYALYANTIGSYNTASGYRAMFNNQNGSLNTANGAQALQNNTNGSYNTASGYAALNSNRNGSQNAAHGMYALYNSISGNDNTALGYESLGNVTNGSGNIAVGKWAGRNIFSGNNNIDIGNEGFGNESDTIRIGSTQTKAVMLGISGGNIASGAGAVFVNPSGLLGTTAAAATVGADLDFQGGADYHHISLSGGNALGYLYGSYLAHEDGLHLSYNFYADANGGGHVFNTGGGTSRLTVGYSGMEFYAGGVNAAPTQLRLAANLSGVSVYGTFNNNSDRNAKQDFTPVSSAEILDKVTQLPISEWSYTADPTTRHIGPVAQDFHSVFSIGTDDKHIAPIDEGGVALAAIQALNQKLTEKEKELETLKQRLENLEKLIRTPKGNENF
jgi:hypothetical protein